MCTFREEHNLTNGSREKKQRKPKTNMVEIHHILYIFVTMVTASRVAEDKNLYSNVLKRISSETKMISGAR